jgi:hypothetical protein
LREEHSDEISQVDNDMISVAYGIDRNFILIPEEVIAQQKEVRYLPPLFFLKSLLEKNRTEQPVGRARLTNLKTKLQRICCLIAKKILAKHEDTGHIVKSRTEVVRATAGIAQNPHTPERTLGDRSIKRSGTAVFAPELPVPSFMKQPVKRYRSISGEKTG